MFVTNLSPALSTLSHVTVRGILSRAHGIRWIVTTWCLLFTALVFSTTHFPDNRAADDAFEAIKAVVDDVPDEALPVAKPSKGFGRATRIALGKTVKQPNQCFSAEHWVAHASDTSNMPSTSAAVPDHLSDAPELRLPLPPMALTPGLRIARVRVAPPPFQAGPTPAFMLHPPVRA